MMNFNEPQTVKDALQWAVLFLGQDKRIEVDLLLAHSIGFSRGKLLAYPEKVLNEEELHKFIQMVSLRKQGEPLQYLLGKEDFMGLDFIVTKDVLIPRSDTEIMVEKIINFAKDMGSIRILDLCTGSGAIAISLSKYLKNAQVVASDISQEALSIARKNAALNEVEEKIVFLQGNLFETVANEEFDIIVSNPPYITTAEMDELSEEVKREPHLALWGGKDGLDFYRKISSEAPKYLKSPGYLFVEIGYQQGIDVKNLFLNNGFDEVEIFKDWNKNDRIVTGKR